MQHLIRKKKELTSEGEKGKSENASAEIRGRLGSSDTGRKKEAFCQTA